MAPHDDLYQTATDHEGFTPAAEVLRPVLTLVHHPDVAAIGRRLVLFDGDVHVLGRSGPGLGPGGLEDAWLSRRHVQVTVEAGRVEVTDLDSRNGVWVNGSRVERAWLEDGDVLGIGGLLLVLGHGPVALGPAHPSMVGVSAAASRLHDQIRQVAELPVSVLISGETGTGKELVARALHEASGRKGELVSVNCGAVAEGVVHSELFGHTRGAFSSAVRARGGLVEQATGGTLFLDEIGDAPATLQAALLRLLENREYRAVGSDELRKTDARFVAATHVDLAAAASEGRFRADLLGRLQRWVIEVPPLRERREDILPLARHFVRATLESPAPLSRRLATALILHSWPRNVRELQGVMEQIAVEWAAGGRQESELQLTPSIAARLGTSSFDTPAPVGGQDRVRAPRRRVKRPDPETLRRQMEEAGGNVRLVAAALGIGRNTLYRWLADAGIDLQEVRQP